MHVEMSVSVRLHIFSLHMMLASFALINFNSVLGLVWEWPSNRTLDVNQETADCHGADGDDSTTDCADFECNKPHSVHVLFCSDTTRSGTIELFLLPGTIQCYYDFL